MTARPEPYPEVGVRTAPLRGRYGLGSVFGKTLRDSRLAIAIVIALVGLMVIGLGSFFDSAYASNRRQLIDLVASLPPAAKGLFWGSGDMSRFDTLGGYLSIDGQVIFKLAPGIWSILALSATLATETRRGSLEFIAASASTKRRIALQKVVAHVTAVGVVVVIVALLVTLTGLAFGSEPMDSIPAGAALSWSVWMGLTGLMAGAVAFLLAPLLGRGAAAGLAGAVMFAAYAIDGFRSWVPAFGTLAKLSWFAWTASFNPLAGGWDWPALALLALAVFVLLAAGVELFARRDLDLGGRSVARLPDLPDAALWVRGPLGRAIAELLPTALAWGVGTGLFGLVIAASSRSFAHSLAATPQLMATLQGLVPEYDLTTPGGLLQGAFMAFAFAIVGLAAATLVGAWAADETSGRLEMLLTTPLGRARWVLAGGAALLVAIGTLTAVTALAIAAGVASAGGDVGEPVVGTFALGLYAAALAGVGLAVSGVASTRFATPVVSAVAIATFLVDFMVPALELPDWLRGLALSADLGQPMVGTWDPAGVVASLALASGGVAIGAWGMRRRDVIR